MGNKQSHNQSQNQSQNQSNLTEPAELKTNIPAVIGEYRDRRKGLEDFEGLIPSPPTQQPTQGNTAQQRSYVNPQTSSPPPQKALSKQPRSKPKIQIWGFDFEKHKLIKQNRTAEEEKKKEEKKITINNIKNYDDIIKELGYENRKNKVLFIFNDNIKDMYSTIEGRGNAILRVNNIFKYKNIGELLKSKEYITAGIPTGVSSGTVGFFENITNISKKDSDENFKKSAKEYIEYAINRIKALIILFEIEIIVYGIGQINEKNPTLNYKGKFINELGYNTFQPSHEIIKHITEQISDLATYNFDENKIELLQNIYDEANYIKSAEQKKYNICNTVNKKCKKKQDWNNIIDLIDNIVINLISYQKQIIINIQYIEDIIKIINVKEKQILPSLQQDFISILKLIFINLDNDKTIYLNETNEYDVLILKYNNKTFHEIMTEYYVIEFPFLDITRCEQKDPEEYMLGPIMNFIKNIIITNYDDNPTRIKNLLNYLPEYNYNTYKYCMKDKFTMKYDTYKKQQQIINKELNNNEFLKNNFTKYQLKTDNLFVIQIGSKNFPTEKKNRKKERIVINGKYDNLYDYFNASKHLDIMEQTNLIDCLQNSIEKPIGIISEDEYIINNNDEILISLKIFDSILDKKKNKYIETKIKLAKSEFISDEININNVKYKLNGYIAHLGNTHGHYIYYYNDIIKNNYYMYNDDKYLQITTNIFDENKIYAYILLYKKINSSQISPSQSSTSPPSQISPASLQNSYLSAKTTDKLYTKENLSNVLDKTYSQLKQQSQIHQKRLNMMNRYNKEIIGTENFQNFQKNKKNLYENSQEGNATGQNVNQGAKEQKHGAQGQAQQEQAKANAKAKEQEGKIQGTAEGKVQEGKIQGNTAQQPHQANMQKHEGLSHKNTPGSQGQNGIKQTNVSPNVLFHSNSNSNQLNTPNPQGAQQAQEKGAQGAQQAQDKGAQGEQGAQRQIKKQQLKQPAKTPSLTHAYSLSNLNSTPNPNLKPKLRETFSNSNLLTERGKEERKRIKPGAQSKKNKQRAQEQGQGHEENQQKQQTIKFNNFNIFSNENIGKIQFEKNEQNTAQSNARTEERKIIKEMLTFNRKDFEDLNEYFKKSINIDKYDDIIKYKNEIEKNIDINTKLDDLVYYIDFYKENYDIIDKYNNTQNIKYIIDKIKDYENFINKILKFIIVHIYNFFQLFRIKYLELLEKLDELQKITLINTFSQNNLETIITKIEKLIDEYNKYKEECEKWNSDICNKYIKSIIQKINNSGIEIYNIIVDINDGSDIIFDDSNIKDNIKRFYFGDNLSNKQDDKIKDIDMFIASKIFDCEFSREIIKVFNDLEHKLRLANGEGLEVIREQLIEEHTKEIAKKDQEIKKQKKDLDVLYPELIKLNKNIEQLETDKKQLQEQLQKSTTDREKQLQQQKTALQTQLQKSKIQSQKKNEEIEEIKKALAGKDTEIESQKQGLAAKEAELAGIEKINAELTEKQTQIKAKEQEIQLKEQEIREKEQELEDEKTSGKHKIQKKEKELTILKKNLEDTTKREKAIKGILTELKTASDALQKKIKEKTATINTNVEPLLVNMKTKINTGLKSNTRSQQRQQTIQTGQSQQSQLQQTGQSQRQPQLQPQQIIQSAIPIASKASNAQNTSKTPTSNSNKEEAIITRKNVAIATSSIGLLGLISYFVVR
jgi:hypothetical protein